MSSGLSTKSVALITLGCAKNLVDSEVMLGFLAEAGYRIVTDPVSADILILNTCGFIKPARDEAEGEIRKLIRLKRRSPDKRLVIAGCYVERKRDVLTKKYPEVDFWLGVKEFDRIGPALEDRSFRPGSHTFLYSDASPRLVSTPRPWAYIKISEGCSHQCAFCSIPLIKGPYRSRSFASIVREAEELARRGAKEVNLVSQDTTFFGRDRGREDGLVDLLRKLSAVQGVEWIRILYGYPEEIRPPLLEAMKERKVCSYLDIPFQHSHPSIIKSMKRGMDGDRALRLIEKIRKTLPDAALRTSLVVGFPGEGKREFNHLRRFVEEAAFDHLGVFTYSPEEGTTAFPLGDPIPEEEKQKRRKEIMEIQAGISLRINRKYVGGRIKVLVEGRLEEKTDVWAGRGRFQAPEVDGAVFIRSPLSRDEALRHPIREVEIVSAEVYDLQGKFIP